MDESLFSSLLAPSEHSKLFIDSESWFFTDVLLLDDEELSRFLWCESPLPGTPNVPCFTPKEPSFLIPILIFVPGAPTVELVVIPFFLDQLKLKVSPGATLSRLRNLNPIQSPIEYV